MAAMAAVQTVTYLGCHGLYCHISGNASRCPYTPTTTAAQVGRPQTTHYCMQSEVTVEAPGDCTNAGGFLLLGAVQVVCPKAVSGW